MKVLRYTLLADGSSDETLVPILNWILDRHGDLRYQYQFATNIPSGALRLRADIAKKLFPCDLLFIHRDAESTPLDDRLRQIADDLGQCNAPYIPVVPVRMTEAWLLSSETAIRRAAGNPNGRVTLQLPRESRWENIPSPKDALFELLRTASEFNGRRLDSFNVHKARRRVAEQTQDYSPLQRLPSFSRVVDTVDRFVEQWRLD